MSSLASFFEENKQLMSVIHRLDEETLRLTLMHICSNSPECLSEVNKYLLLSEDAIKAEQDGSDTENEDDDGNEDQGTSNDSDTGRKRKRTKVEDDQKESKSTPSLVPRYRKCKNCKLMFDVTENDEEQCIFHPGEREMKKEWHYDFDHNPGDQDEVLDYDEDWRVQGWPQYFPWSCCKRPANDEGCVEQEHVEFKSS